MNKTKKVFYAITASISAGIILGMLFAPEKGAETRGKIRRLKNKLSCHSNGIDDNKSALEELSSVLEKELEIVNEKIAKLS